MMIIDNSERNTISVDGIDVYFGETGESKHQSLILIHGLGDCARSWDYFAQAMSDEFRVITLDSRGHGQSDKSLNGEYPFKDYVKDLQILVEHLEIESLILVGHGNGGRIALSYAHDNPNKISGLVIADANLMPKYCFNVTFPADINSSLNDDSIEPFVNVLKDRQPLSSESALLHQANMLTFTTKEGIRTWKHDRAVMKNNDQPDLSSQWENLKCPTLLLRGRQSNMVSHEEAVAMKERLSQCSIVELEGGGHWLYQEAPGSFESATRWFFQKHGLV